MSRPRRVFALDLGTTKVCCAAAELDGDSMRILGVGEAPSRGIRKGSIIEIDSAAEAVAEAVDSAEQMAGIPVDSVAVGVGGISTASQNSRGVVAVSGGRGEVREQDVARAIEAARAISVPSDRKILHVLPQHFTVDGQQGVRDAVGMAGGRLEVDAHIVTAANTATQNTIKVMHKAGLEVEDLVLQILASAEAVLNEDDMERGVAVVDIGGGTTDVAVFTRGSISHCATIPVGGSHVTGDLAVGLRCDLETAETVKRAYGHCLQLTIPADATVTLRPIGYEEAVQIPQRFLAEIIAPRAREIAALVAAEIEKAGPATALVAGVMMTGGSSLLRGFADVMQQMTDLPARVVVPEPMHGMNDEISGPHHATVVGLLRWAVRHRGGSVSLVGKPQSRGIPISGRMRQWVKELF